MDTPLVSRQRLLLIDTCGETAGVAVSVGAAIVAIEDLTQGMASAGIVAAVSRLLQQTHLKLQDLHAVGVVRGPGSFTGVRAGLAAAKGFCEAAGIPLIGVSRLQVLAASVVQPIRFAVLDAGRGELYLRDVETEAERLCTLDELRSLASSDYVAIAEERVAERLAGCCKLVMRPLRVADVLETILEELDRERSTPDSFASSVLIDAHYIRQESDIYRKPSTPDAGG